MFHVFSCGYLSVKTLILIKSSLLPQPSGADVGDDVGGSVGIRSPPGQIGTNLTAPNSPPRSVITPSFST